LKTIWKVFGHKEVTCLAGDIVGWKADADSGLMPMQDKRPTVWTFVGCAHLERLDRVMVLQVCTLTSTWILMDEVEAPGMWSRLVNL
jgi:hypothetical protein